MMINPAVQSYLDFLVQERNDQYNLIKDYRTYTDGDHSATLNDDQKALLNDNPDFVLNICPSVVNAKCDRLAVQNIGLGEEQEELEALVRQWWDMSRMDEGAGDLHFAASRDGDAFLIVDWDTERDQPTLTVNQVYDGTSGVDIAYADGNHKTALYATKRWAVQDGTTTGVKSHRLNIYYDDRVEKFVSEGMDEAYKNAGWLPYTDDASNPTAEDAHIYHYTDDHQAIGLPVIHFRNNANGNPYGRSDLADVVKGLQDSINLAGVSLVAASQLAGFPINYFLGVDGTNATYAAYPGAILTVPSGADGSVQAGQFPPANLAQLSAVVDDLIRQAAFITKTPLNYFQVSGQIAAEGTLQQQEAPLLAKVKRCQQAWGNRYEDTVRMMLRFHTLYGDGTLSLEEIEALPIHAEWQDAQTRNEKAESERLLLWQQLGVPSEIIWRKLGLSPDEIEQAQLAQRTAERGNIAEALATLGARNNGA